VLCHHHHQRLAGAWEFFFFFFFFFFVLLSWLFLSRLETFHYVHGGSIAVLEGRDLIVLSNIYLGIDALRRAGLWSKSRLVQT